jgi:hypothetical protein
MNTHSKFWLGAVLLALNLLFLALSAHSQGDVSVVLESTPPAAQIGPDSTFTRTTLRVVDQKGKPIPNAYLKLHVDAPPGNAFISTDFPLVEQTPLLHYEGTLPAGSLEFEYIYPIRGTYTFEVEAGREAAALSFKDNLTLTLQENRSEVLNFVIFMIILLGLGIVAGFIIGRGSRAQRLATAGLGLLVVVGLGLAGASVKTVQAHGGGDGSDTPAFSESATNGDLTVTYGMDPGAGRVGTLNILTFIATDAQQQLVPDSTFEVTFWHIEDEKPVFATSLYAPDGETALTFQFFDGAEHELRVVASNTLGTVQLQRAVEVEGLDPPFLTKLKTTFYLALVTFIGVLIGLRIQVVQGGRKQTLAPLGV